MKFLLLMCGEGLGHTSRCLALGKEFLAAGHEVNFGAYKHSKKLVEKTGYLPYEIPSEIRLAGETGAFDIKKSIIEKENLLKEIHYRVKNNMQIISNLINLQIKHVHETESVHVLNETQERIDAMAMVHKNLYESSEFTNLNFKDYTEKLVAEILSSQQLNYGTIKTELDIEDIKMNMETAIPCGLIINELITNSVKYAFPEHKGTIRIELKSYLDELELIIADNGIGLPKNIYIKINS